MEFHCGTRHCGVKNLCSLSVEVQIYPPTAELYFRDERYCDPISTQIRFSVILHQSRRGSVHWKVIDQYGQPGRGTVDANGLYQAPAKGTLPNGTTEFVVASVKGYPFIQARAAITLVGEGPLPDPVPAITIFPKTVNLYRSNEYMDSSNSQQIFRADIFNSNTVSVVWKKNGITISGSENKKHYTYVLESYVPIGIPILISAHLLHDTSIFATAAVMPVYYSWPANSQ